MSDEPNQTVIVPPTMGMMRTPGADEIVADHDRSPDRALLVPFDSEGRCIGPYESPGDIAPWLDKLDAVKLVGGTRYRLPFSMASVLDLLTDGDAERCRGVYVVLLTKPRKTMSEPMHTLVAGSRIEAATPQDRDVGRVKQYLDGANESERAEFRVSR